MKTLARTLAVAALSLLPICATVYGFEESGLFGLNQEVENYHLLLSYSVYAGYHDDAPVSYAELPPVAGESGFWLFPEKDDCVVVWSEATTNLWHWAKILPAPGEKSRVDGKTMKDLAAIARKDRLLRFYQKRIPLSLGLAIRAVWQRVLVSNPEPPPLTTFDGVTVIFGAAETNGASVFWKTQSPREGAPAYELVQLAHAIRKLVVANDDTDVRKLLATMANQRPEPTARTVTPRAGARVAPAPAVAHP